MKAPFRRFSGHLHPLACLGLGLLVFVTAPGGLETSDAAIRLETARSLVEGRGGALGGAVSGGVPGRNGAIYSYFNIGQVALFIPWIALGQVLNPQNPERVAKFLYSVLFLPFVFVALGLLLFRVSKEVGQSRTPIVVLLLATPLLHYARIGQEENLLALAYASALLGIVLVTRKMAPTGWLWLGSGLAGSIMLRLASVPTVVLCVVMFTPALWRDLRSRTDRAWVMGGLAVGLTGVAVTLWWNWYRFGNVLETGYQAVFTAMGQRMFEPSELPLHMVALLLSPGRGLLLYAPVLLWALWNIKSLTTLASAGFVVLAGLLFIANLLFFSAYTVWWGGFGWGPRFLVAPTVFLAPLLLRISWRPPLAWVFVGASGLLSFASIVLPSSTEDHIGALIRQRGETCDAWTVRCSGVALRPVLAVGAISTAFRGERLPALGEGAAASSEEALNSSDFRAPAWWPVRAAYRLNRQGLAPIALTACLGGILVALMLVVASRATTDPVGTDPAVRAGSPGT